MTLSVHAMSVPSSQDTFEQHAVRLVSCVLILPQAGPQLVGGFFQEVYCE